MEWLTLHDNILTEVLVTVHTGGEKSLRLLLVVVEWLTLHDNILTEVLITVHTSGEKSGVSWSLVVVEWLSLHDNVLTEVLITVHAGGEEGSVGWSLVVVEWLSLHDNILTKVLITVHAGGEKSLGLLVIVEWLSLHNDVLTKVLITIHTSSEQLVIWDAGEASTADSGSGACAELEESSGGSDFLVVGEDLLGSRAVIGIFLFVLKRDGTNAAKKSGNSEFHYE